MNLEVTPNLQEADRSVVVRLGEVAVESKHLAEKTTSAYLRVPPKTLNPKP